MSDVNDFVETAVNRTAVRDLEYPIGTIGEFDDLVEDFISANPSECVGYTTNKGVAVPPIFRNREYYSVKVDIAEDGKALGTVSVQVPTIAAFGTVAVEIY